MEFFNDLVRYGYLSHALAACILSGITCGIVGTYVVCRRMVFAGGITHASFGGLGIAFYLGINPIAGAMIFAVLSAFGIEWTSERGRIREDSAIGIVWSVGMAAGALFMSLRPGYSSGDLAAYLFGSIITVTDGDVAALALLTAVVLAGCLLWLRPVIYVAFDRAFARSRGIRTRAISYLMAALVAVTIVLDPHHGHRAADLAPHHAGRDRRHALRLLPFDRRRSAPDRRRRQHRRPRRELSFRGSARRGHNIYPHFSAYNSKTAIFA